MKLIIDIPKGIYNTLCENSSADIVRQAVIEGMPLEQIKSEIKECLWKLSEGNTYLDITREEVENAILEIIDKYLKGD